MLFTFFLSILTAASSVSVGNTCSKSGVSFYGTAAERIVDKLADKGHNGDYEKCIDGRPSDCGELDRNKYRTGVYTIYPDNSPQFDVVCDMDTDGGGWTVFQRRKNGLVNFYRDWDAYKRGFGFLNGEFWLGNERIHKITSQEDYTLRVDLEDFSGNHRYATYSKFSVGPESRGYILDVNGYNGNAGDSIKDHSGHQFTTKDRDNDKNDGNCAVMFKGAWWYTSCHASNLNGLYLKGNHSSYANGVNWKSWTAYNYSLKATRMMIKRTKLF